MESRNRGAAPSNPRLHPPRWSNRFLILSRLRCTLTSIAEQHVPRRAGLVLVDFGCGSVPYRSLFAHVSSYVAVDMSDNPHADVHASPESVTPLPSCHADLVLSTQVLEHVSDPGQYLRECHRILKPEGRLILSTHGYWMYHPDPHDFWRWTGEGLRKTVSDMGFQIDAWHGLMGLAPTAVYLLQDALTPVIPKFGRRLFWLTAQLLAAALDRLHSDAQRDAESCVYVLVARKRSASGSPAGDGTF